MHSIIKLSLNHADYLPPCHLEISFVVLNKSHHFGKKSQNLIGQIEHNDSKKITLLYNFSSRQICIIVHKLRYKILTFLTKDMT